MAASRINLVVSYQNANSILKYNAEASGAFLMLVSLIKRIWAWEPYLFSQLVGSFLIGAMLSLIGLEFRNALYESSVVCVFGQLSWTLNQI